MESTPFRVRGGIIPGIDSFDKIRVKEKHMPAENGTILVIPEGERVQQLAQKLKDYEKEWEQIREAKNLQRTPPEIRHQIIASQSTWYAIRILEALLQRGTINSYEIADEMYKSNGEQLDPSTFDYSFEKILQYAQTGEAFGKPLPPVRE